MVFLYAYMTVASIRVEGKLVVPNGNPDLSIYGGSHHELALNSKCYHW